jgi:hypothetical protein
MEGGYIDPYEYNEQLEDASARFDELCLGGYFPQAYVLFEQHPEIINEFYLESLALAYAHFKRILGNEKAERFRGAVVSSLDDWDTIANTEEKIAREGEEGQVENILKEKTSQRTRNFLKEQGIID